MNAVMMIGCPMIGEKAADLILGKSLASLDAPYWTNVLWESQQR